MCRLILANPWGCTWTQVLDMPTADLGAPAYRKIDFEVILLPVLL